MPIATSEIQWFNSALTSDNTPAQNGGRPAQIQNISGIKNNLFPDVSAGDRASGVQHWRKLFVEVKNADELPLVATKISIETGTPGDSYCLLYPGTWTDTQDQVSARPYGYGTLATTVSAGATSLTVTSEADFSALSAKPFQVGDLLRVDARSTVLEAGLSEYAEIATISSSGVTMTIGLADALANGYASGASVASVMEPGDLQAGYSGKSVTGGVTYNDIAHPIAVPEIGGVYQTWTVTVTNAATGALSVSGDTIGPVGVGSTGVDLAPSNPLGGVYFMLSAAGWGGAPVTGDTLVVTTHPAGVGYWCQRIVPAGSSRISLDSVSVCVEGESA
jgi:hypothetical protein